MGVKKEVTLEDVRRDPKLLDRFIEEHPSKADKARFGRLLKAMCEPVKTKPEGDQT